MKKTRPLRILYDQNMLLGKTLFPRLGDAKPCEGRKLTADDLKDADLLFVRSTTKLTRDLLSGSGLRFIGSGVAGTDHVDFNALQTLGIPFASAPGCNAESVADYFISALLALGESQGRSWQGATLGIVGVGHVGKWVWKFAEEALGMRVIGCDPPRQRDPNDTAAKDFLPLGDLLAQSDVITFHTPLIKEGVDKTVGLYSGKIVRSTKPGAVLFNLARGPICDNALLYTMLGAGLLSDVIMDCWEGEPDYSADLASLAFITTPHIAGHAYEGKANGTIAVYKAACDLLKVPYGRTPPSPKAPTSEIKMSCRGKTDEAILRALTKATCDIEADSARFRGSFNEDPEIRKVNFDSLRKNYPLRRLFGATTVTLTSPNKTIVAKVKALGFKIKPLTNASK